VGTSCFPRDTCVSGLPFGPVSVVEDVASCMNMQNDFVNRSSLPLSNLDVIHGACKSSFLRSNLFEIYASEDVQCLDTPTLKKITRVGPTRVLPNAKWFVEISKPVQDVDRWSGACIKFLADRYRQARAVTSFGQSQAGMQEILRKRTC